MRITRRLRHRLCLGTTVLGVVVGMVSIGGLDDLMPVLPLRTARLTLRVLGPADADAVAAYRSDPEVARFQSWEVPFTTAAAAMLTDQAELTDLAPGRWVQIAIEDAGRVVGDVAVRLDADSTTAVLGYTLSRAAQGRGLAREAVGAVVEAVFSATPVRRIQATVDPANAASMRVVEQLGFHFEGVERESERVRGEWVDNVRFALLESGHREWSDRPQLPVGAVELVEITSDNLSAVGRLETHWYQKAFVAPMSRSFAQGVVPETFDNGEPMVPWYRAIVADGDIAGFVMVALPSPGNPAPYLWRLLIDRRYQRRRVGERAISLLVQHFRTAGCGALLVSWADGLGGPRNFYLGLGFVEVGTTGDGEIEGRLELGH